MNPKFSTSVKLEEMAAISTYSIPLKIFVTSMWITIIIIFPSDADYDKVISQGSGALAALPPPMDQLVTDVAVYDDNILTIGK